MIVEKNLEKLLPAHEQLIAKEIFTEEETKRVLEKRRTYEYTLLSRNSTLDQFLAYIKYETLFLELLNKRKLEKNIDATNRLLADTVFLSHIHSLFRRATNKFSSDSELFDLYLDFCQSTRSTKSLENAFADYVHFHALNPNVWIRACKFEYLENNNHEKAIEYLDQAIELIPSNEELYLLYGEVLFSMSKIIEQRREIHGIEETSDFGRAPAFIFQKGVEKCSGKNKLTRGFLDLFKKYEVDTSRLLEIIENSNNVEVLSAFIETQKNPINQYEQLIEKTENRELKKCFALFLEQQTQKSKFLSVVQSFGDLSDEEAIMFSKKLINFGFLKEAKTMIENLTNFESKKVCLALQCLNEPDTKKFIEQSTKLLENNRELYSYFVLLVAQREISEDEWFDVIQKFGRKVNFEEVGSILEFTHLKFGYQLARKTFDHFFSIIIPNKSFIRSSIQVLTSIENFDRNEIRHLYESLVSKFGQTDNSVWLEYAEFEYNQKCWKKLESIRNRACRTLVSSSEFSGEYYRRFCRK